MEVLSSAAGVISLGIQTCSGLLSYYRSYKDSSANIEIAHSSILNLRDTLLLLQETLSNPSLDPSRATHVKQSIISCAGCLQKLQDRLHKIQIPPAPKRVEQRSSAAFKKISYPFKEDTLLKLSKDAHDACHRLALAVQVLQLDHSIDLRNMQSRIEAHAKDSVVRVAKIEKSISRLSADVADTLEQQRAEQFRQTVAWLSPPDPSTTHNLARRNREPQTGLWLLESERYERWKNGRSRHLWVYGKAGCGKTFLTSSVVEDIQQHCEASANAKLVYFYFSFAEVNKQSFENLLCSLLRQLAQYEPCRSLLQREYRKAASHSPELSALEKILLCSICQFQDIFLALDALDECPDLENARQDLLSYLEKLLSKAPNIKVFATSRRIQEINDFMNEQGAEACPVDKGQVDADIRRYVSSELSRDYKLCRLNEATRIMILESLTAKSDGMFRWAYCQLEQLKMLRSTKPSYIRQVLRSLPATLEGTYEQMLYEIPEMYTNEALILLRWLAFAERPLSLVELAEASIIRPGTYTPVPIEDRGTPEDVPTLLSGLVQVQWHPKRFTNTWVEIYGEDAGFPTQHQPVLIEEPHQIESSCRSQSHLRLTLAHFSVKEYLLSNNILEGKASVYALDTGLAQSYLAQACFEYVLHCFEHSKVTPIVSEDDYPLCVYAMRYGIHHQILAENEPGYSHSIGRLQLRIMEKNQSIVARLSSLKVIKRSMRSPDGFSHSILWGQSVPAVFLACLLGLTYSAGFLLEESPLDLNSTVPTRLLLLPGNLHTPLHCAVYSGSVETVELLLRKGADIEAGAESESSTPLYVASWLGLVGIVNTLIEHGANVNARGGLSDRPLQAACSWGHAEVAQKLLDAGAEKDVSGGIDGSALCAASKRGDTGLCTLLLDQGVNVNFAGNCGWTALHVASETGCTDVVELLLRRKASLDAKTADGQTALHWAAARRHREVIEHLLRHNDAIDFDLVEITSVIETFEVSWKDVCDSIEFNDDDDIAWFGRAHNQSEKIREILSGALTIRSMPYWSTHGSIIEII